MADALRDGSLTPADLGTRNWAPQAWWRVYPQRYGPTGFNDTPHGNARFSPLEHAGAIVPVLYAGTTVGAALMETVLHDVPSPSIGFLLRLSAKTEKRLGSFQPAGDLVLADLSALGLRRLGLDRADVIDSDKAQYPITRQLAQWIYTNRPDVQGIS
ncbi:RES family NAD+ phosphorylase [Ramlibacter monticola]|uniref:RES family NAD+ phosphorylase n=1 Tax=Ramlibacter monticola TaxID=1926872 RepID=A0A936Z321_9BURK|nr:RES family NAD+ phosphorylase [Ramlibacter monticola]MBL0394103.1 RES family NAD+ phosphorylase [Ramlibacter monticola]